MGHTNVKNTFVGVPKIAGGIWHYPAGTPLPTDASTPHPVGLKPIGGVSDEGYTYTSERATDKKKDWNGDKVRSIQTSKDDTFEITFIEFLNPAVMAEVFGAENVTVVPATASTGTVISTKSVADVLPHGAYVIDTFDGKVKRRRVIPDAQPDKIDPVAEKPGDWSVQKITYDVYPDSQGVTSYTYTELDDKLVPSTWDVAVAGSAGTIVFTVDGQSTTAQAYNVSTTALKTALEGLSTVGAGNATVTGTAGTSYHIVLARGGVLSAVGAGGATATVTAA